MPSSFREQVALCVAANCKAVGYSQPINVRLGYGDSSGKIVYSRTERLVYFFEGVLGGEIIGRGVASLPSGVGLLLRDSKDDEGTPIQIRIGPGERYPEVFRLLKEAYIGNDGRLPSEQAIDMASLPTQDRIRVLRPEPSVPPSLSFTVPGTFYYIQPSTGLRRVVHNPSGAVSTQVAALAAGQHQAAMLYFDTETGVTGVATASAVTAGGTLPSRSEFYDYTFANIPIPDYGIPLTNVYLYYGQTQLAGDDFYREYDPRPFLHANLPVPNATIATKTANYTLTSSDYTVLVDATGGAVTITLPTAASAYNSVTHIGKVYNVKKIDSSSNNMVLDGNGAETIDGAANITTATQWASYTVQSNGVGWFIL